MKVVFIHMQSLYRGCLHSISWWQESEIIFVDRWSSTQVRLYDFLIVSDCSQIDQITS